MKRYTLYILVAILGMLNIQPAAAQEVQDALYIFRNDGGFNAFFFADIQRIEYSKIDTLGVEQDDYVVQEVYALDSCFRIPISAIDSVAFVTPETKYKADVVLYDENIANYIVASDSINWFRLATNTPTSLIPKKGDKLVIESESTFLPNGMAGLVERVEESATGYTVNMGEVEIQDIYERLLVKAGAGAMNNATSRTRGLLDPIDTSIEPEPIHWGKFKGSFTAQGSKDFISSWFPSAESTVDAVGSISYDDDLYTTLRIFLYADMWGVKYDHYQRDDIKNSHVVSIGGAVTSRFEIPFGGLKKPIKLGDRSLVLFNATWGVFIEGSLAVNINFSDNLNASAFNEYGYTQNVGDGWEESIGVITNDVRRTIVKNRDTNFKSISGKGSLGSGLYGKIEAKLKFNKIKFQLGIGINIGVRVELQPTVDIDALVASTRFKTPIFYRMANFDGAVTATGFANIGGSLKAGKKSFVFQPEVPNSREFGIVPNITDINWIPEKKTPWRGKLESNIKRDVLIPMSVGFAVYDEEKEKLVEDYWTSWNYWRESTIQKYNNVFDHFNPGKKYWAYAQTTLFGIPVLTTSETDFSLGDPYIKPEKKTFDFDEAYNFADIEVITNIANVEFKESDSWISKPTWLPQTPSLLFDCDPLPDNVNIRKGKITAVGRDWDGNIIKEDSISITQRRGILKITPANLEFDKKGGTQKVTIETTYDNVEVVKGSEYTYPLPFEMSLNASKTELTVTVPENTTGDSRRAAIIVSATTEEGKKVSEAIYLYQSAEEGTDENKLYVNFNPAQFSFSQEAGKQALTSTCNFAWYHFNREYTWTSNGEDKHQWFSMNATQYDETGTDGIFTDQWEIEVEKNDWGFSRAATITVTLTDKEKTMSATAKITISQDSGNAPTITITPSSVTFGSEGGTQELKVETNQPRFGFRFSDNNWLSGEAEKGGIIKLTAEANNTGADRSANMYVYGADGNGDQVIVETVPIKQSWQPSVIGNYDFSKCKYITIELTMKAHYTGVWDSDRNDENIVVKFPENFWTTPRGLAESEKTKTTVSYNGRGAHIECSLRTDSTWEWMGKNHLETEYTIVMDIDDLVNGKITNLSAKCNYYSKQVADASVGGNVEEGWSREELSASNIPLPDKSGKVVGNKSTGTTINSCTREHKSGWMNYKYSKLPSDDYSITVKFHQ